MAAPSTDDNAKGANEALDGIPDSNANDKGKANLDANGDGDDGMHFVEWIIYNEATRCKHDHDHQHDHVASLSAFEGG